jgi:uncharacterized protein YjiS (DUF1127 family)
MSMKSMWNAWQVRRKKTTPTATWGNLGKKLNQSICEIKKVLGFHLTANTNPRKKMRQMRVRFHKFQKEGIKGTNNSLEKLQRTFCVNSHLSGLKTRITQLWRTFPAIRRVQEKRWKRRKRGRNAMSQLKLSQTSFSATRRLCHEVRRQEKPVVYVPIRKGDDNLNESLKPRTKPRE